MIVLDTSAAIEMLLNRSLGWAIRERIANPDVAVHAPQLLVVEVLQVLRRRVAAGLTTTDRAATAIDLLNQLDANLHDHRELAARIWALRDNLTAYDATFVALAEVLDAPLLTTDAHLARAPGNNARVELIGR